MNVPFENSPEKAIRPDINGLISSIENYDEESYERAIKRDLIERKELDAQIDEQWRQKRLQELQAQYGNVLTETGLDMESVFPPRGFINNKDDMGQIQSSEIGLNISDSKRFLSYLNLLSGQELSTEEKKSLDTIIRKFEQQLIDQYDVSDTTDDGRFFNLIANMKEIIDAYRRLGLEDSIHNFARLHEVYRLGYLRQYLIIERMEYFAPDDNAASPAHWHNEMGIELYNQAWTDVVEIFHELMANPNPEAIALAGQLKERLFEAIDVAKRNMIGEQTKYHKEYKKDYRKAFLERLENVKRVLV